MNLTAHATSDRAHHRHRPAKYNSRLLRTDRAVSVAKVQWLYAHETCSAFSDFDAPIAQCVAKFRDDKLPPCLKDARERSRPGRAALVFDIGQRQDKV